MAVALKKTSALNEDQNIYELCSRSVVVAKKLSEQQAAAVNNIKANRQNDGFVMAENSTEVTDQQLVERVKQGDKGAFDLLVIKYQNKVASIISRYVSDYHEVADVAQESFVKAYRAIESFRGDSAFYTWIYRIAINTAKNYLVSKGRRPPSSDMALDDPDRIVMAEPLENRDTPDGLLQRSQLEHLVRKTLTGLPEELRVALTLREFDGLSYEEISRIMECPVGTVRSRIFRAREAIDQVVAPLMEPDLVEGMK